MKRSVQIINDLPRSPITELTWSQLVASSVSNTAISNCSGYSSSWQL